MNRFRRKATVDPWQSYDNFRVNHRALRDFALHDAEDKKHSLKIEYLAENKFNVFIEDEHNKLHLVLKDAELIKNKEKDNEVIIRTDSE